MDETTGCAPPWITFSPTRSPTKLPTAPPSPVPTRSPTKLPTPPPTPVPTRSPTKLPTSYPTPLPTNAPTTAPTYSPVQAGTSPCGNGFYDQVSDYIKDWQCEECELPLQMPCHGGSPCWATNCIQHWNTWTQTPFTLNDSYPCLWAKNARTGPIQADPSMTGPVCIIVEADGSNTYLGQVAFGTLNLTLTPYDDVYYMYGSGALGAMGSTVWFQMGGGDDILVVDSVHVRPPIAAQWPKIRMGSGNNFFFAYDSKFVKVVDLMNSYAEPDCVVLANMTEHLAQPWQGACQANDTCYYLETPGITASVDPKEITIWMNNDTLHCGTCDHVCTGSCVQGLCV